MSQSNCFWFPSQKIPIQKHIQPFQQPRTNCQLLTCFKVHAAWYRIVNLKEIWSFSCWAPPTDLVRINYHPSSVYPWGFCRVWPQRQHIQIYPNQVTFIWITMSPLEVVSWRKIWVVLPDSLDTIWWLDDTIVGKTLTSIPPPQCHHLLLVSRIIHINPFLVSALVGAENQVQHGTIKTIVGLRLHSDDGWDFWRGDCHQRKETELTQTTNSMQPQLWKKAKVKKVVCSIFEISVF